MDAPCCLPHPPGSHGCPLLLTPSPRVTWMPPAADPIPQGHMDARGLQTTTVLMSEVSPPRLAMIGARGESGSEEDSVEAFVQVESVNRRVPGHRRGLVDTEENT